MISPKNIKILIVEDEELLQVFLIEILKKEGFNVVTASNGDEGLKTAISEQPDLILLDIIMPVMDGMEMLKELREDEWGKSASVLMLTNLDDVKRVTEASDFGVDDYLVKNSSSTDDIINKVKEKLNII